MVWRRGLRRTTSLPREESALPQYYQPNVPTVLVHQDSAEMRDACGAWLQQPSSVTRVVVESPIPLCPWPDSRGRACRRTRCRCGDSGCRRQGPLPLHKYHEGGNHTNRDTHVRIHVHSGLSVPCLETYTTLHLRMAWCYSSGGWWQLGECLNMRAFQRERGLRKCVSIPVQRWVGRYTVISVSMPLYRRAPVPSVWTPPLRTFRY